MAIEKTELLRIFFRRLRNKITKIENDAFCHNFVTTQWYRLKNVSGKEGGHGKDRHHPAEKKPGLPHGRPDRLCSLLFAVAALILCAGIGAVLWHEWQGTRPTAAEQAEADEIERADGGEEEIAAVTEEAADGKIVVAIDPGHGGVNPKRRRRGRGQPRQRPARGGRHAENRHARL